jgi:hypothetical protein
MRSKAIRNGTAELDGTEHYRRSTQEAAPEMGGMPISGAGCWGDPADRSKPTSPRRWDAGTSMVILRPVASAARVGGAAVHLMWMVMQSLCRMVPSSPLMSRLRSNAEPGVSAVLLRSNSTAPAPPGEVTRVATVM